MYLTETHQISCPSFSSPLMFLFSISCTFVLCHVIFIFYKSFLQDLFTSLVFCIYLSWLRSIDQMHSVLSQCSCINHVRISCDFCIIIVKFVLEIYDQFNPCKNSFSYNTEDAFVLCTSEMDDQDLLYLMNLLVNPFNYITSSLHSVMSLFVFYSFIMHFLTLQFTLLSSVLLYSYFGLQCTP